MDKLLVNERLNEIASGIAERTGLELVHIEVVGSGKQTTVRILIDKPEGITHDDCSLFSREISPILDNEDLIDSAYLLEVSSPGLERELYSIRDFEKFAGKLAKLKTRQKIDGQQNFRGRIKGISGENIIFDDKTSGEVTFPWAQIAKANLELDLEEELKRDRAM